MYMEFLALAGDKLKLKKTFKGGTSAV